MRGKQTKLLKQSILYWSHWKSKSVEIASTDVLKKTFFLGATGLMTLFTGLILLSLFANWQIQRLDVNLIPEMEESSHVYDRDGHELCQFWKQKRTTIPLSQISTHLQKAVLAMEDHSFYNHHGYDVAGILRAVAANLHAGKIEQGGSTLTQQLAKNTLLTAKRSYWRKLQELWLARRIEKRYSKDQILELYLNRIYWGSGFYGVESAAQGYFGKSARDLTLGEAAMLAGITSAPSLYSPHKSYELATKRREIVFDAMLRHQFANEADISAARSQSLQVLPLPESESNGVAYASDAVRSQVLDILGYQKTFAGGLKIYTTIDGSAQLTAQAAVVAHLTNIEKQFKLAERRPALPEGHGTDYLQAALVSMDVQTGEIRALVGGRNFAESKFNRALYGRRQPGSAFKPIVYTAALNAGMTPATVIEDAPLQFETAQGPYRPTNADHAFAGAVTLRTALRKSINSVAIQTGQTVGLGEVVSLARALGLEGPLPQVISLPLGAAEATLLEMVRAYSAFPNQGNLVRPTLLRRIEDKQGHVLYEATSERHPVLNPEVAFLMTSMLTDVINRGTGSGVRSAGFQLPAGGKTGTTDDYRDAWFIGFTPEVITGVWIGYDQPHEIARRAYGARLAVPLWTSFMKQLRLSAKSFAKPPGIVEEMICSRTGLLAGPECDAVQEYFSESNVPQTVCAGVHAAETEDEEPSTLPHRISLGSGAATVLN